MSADHGMKHWNYHSKAMVLFSVLNDSHRCSSNDKRLSSIIARYFCEVPWYTLLLLEVKGRSGSLLTFLMKITSWAYLLGSGLKLIFHWCAQWLILGKSLLRSAAELSTLWTTKNNKLSSANNLAFDYIWSVRSFVYIKSSISSSIKPCGTPAFILVNVENWKLVPTVYK